MNELYKKALLFAEIVLRKLMTDFELHKDPDLYVDQEFTNNNLHTFIIKGNHPKYTLCYVVYDGLNMTWDLKVYNETSHFDNDMIGLMFDSKSI